MAPVSVGVAGRVMPLQVQLATMAVLRPPAVGRSASVVPPVLLSWSVVGLAGGIWLRWWVVGW